MLRKASSQKLVAKKTTERRAVKVWKKTLRGSSAQLPAVDLKRDIDPNFWAITKLQFSLQREVSNDKKIMQY